MTLFPSACIWNYKPPLEDALRQIKETAFHYIDVEPETLDAKALEVQKQLGLKVSCVAIDHHLPSGASLDGKDSGAMRKAVDHLKQALHKSSDLGATTAYVAPCSSSKSLDSFSEAIRELAGEAAQKEIRFCVEHAPGRALPSARDVLAFLEKLGHSNAFLLMDVGHTLLSKENAWDVAAAAGDRLGYVQVNDNDGRKDRHWPLLEGLLTEATLQKTLEAISNAGYQSTLGIELDKNIRTSLISGLSKNRNLLLRLQVSPDSPSLQEPEERRKH